MTILSGFAYGAWVVAVALFCETFFSSKWFQRNTPVQIDAFQTGAACFALASFYLLPPGSLPPFANISWGGILLYGFLAFATILSRQKRAVMPCFTLFVVCAAFFRYAQHRGMPGSPFNLGTFTAMPVWETASFPETGAFLLLGAGFILTARCFLPDGKWPDFAGTLLYLAITALFVTLFLPWNTAPFAAWPGPVVAGIDFLLFWTKVLVCCFLSCRIPQRDWFLRSGLVLSIASALFLTAFSR